MQALSLVHGNGRAAENPLEILCDAFSQDPAIRWMYPGDRQYESHFPEFARAFGGAAFEHDTAIVSADGSGLALWIPPEAAPDEGAIVEVIERSVHREQVGEVFTLIEQMGRFHPAEPHWYLPMIGVRRERQGLGIGQLLMHPVLERCDRSGLPAYLESTNPRNIPFYERLGFESVGRIQSETSPLIIPMVRKPLAP